MDERINEKELTDLASAEVEVAQTLETDGTKYDPALSDLGLGKEYKGIRGFWRRTLDERKYLIACFLLPALLMWLVHITLGVYPFGKNSVLVLDLNAQYVYYFQALRDIITEGGSLLYSFRRCLGGEFMGIIGYYVASPFSVIIAMFPETMITEALLVMFLLKTGLCGLTFGIYIEATRKRNRPLTVIFSTMYALCAYAVVMQHNTMWIDNLIYLPLILLGVENIIKKGKYKMFVITLALAIMSNFYIGYMTCIFVALYFFYYYFSRSPEERNPLGVKFHLARKIVQIGCFALIAVTISAVYIWCSYYSLTFGKTEFTNPSYSFQQRFDFLDLAAKMYFGSYDTVRPEGLPFLYSGTLTVILMPLYFLVKKISFREKVASLLLCAAMVLSFNGSTIDLVWHGMQKPNWLNYRYSFMLCFFFLILAYKAFENAREIGFKQIAISGLVSSLILLVLQNMEYENLPDLVAVWASLGFIIVYVLLMRGVTWDKEVTRKTAVLVMVIVVSFEMYAGALANLVALDKDVVISERASLRDYLDKYSPAVDLTKEKDTGFYRMEKLSYRKNNDNMALGIYGISNSTSTLNKKIINLLADYGIASKSHWSKYLGATPVFDSIFGIKYLIGESSSKASELYEYRWGTNQGMSVYENPYAMSVAAGVNEALASLDLSAIEDVTQDPVYMTPFEKMNATVGAMLGDTDGTQLFNPIPTADMTNSGCTKSHLATQYKYVKSGDSTATVTMKFIADSDDMIYMYIPAESKKECNLTVNGVSKGTYFGNETHRIVEIGTFTEGEEVSVTLELKNKEVYLMMDCDYFASLDLDKCREVLPQLQTSGYNITSHTEDTLIGTIHVLPGQELIYTSIPYDEGWIITANGQEVEKFEILEGLMAFRLNAGSYNLEFKYRPDCAVYGIMISAAGVVIFIAVWVCDWLIQKRKAKKAVYATVSADGGEGPEIAELDLGVPMAEETADTVEDAAEENAVGDSASDSEDAE